MKWVVGFCVFLSCFNSCYSISGVASTNLKIYPDLFVSLNGGYGWNRVSLSIPGNWSGMTGSLVLCTHSWVFVDVSASTTQSWLCRTTQYVRWFVFNMHPLWDNKSGFNSGHPHSNSYHPLYPDWIGVWRCWFLRGGATGVPRENLSEKRTNSKLKPHMMLGPGIEPRPLR